MEDPQKANLTLFFLDIFLANSELRTVILKFLLGRDVHYCKFLKFDSY